MSAKIYNFITLIIDEVTYGFDIAMNKSAIMDLFNSV